MATPIIAAIIALAIGGRLSLVSPLLVALLLGVIAANAVDARTREAWDSSAFAKILLRGGIVLIGFRISFSDLWALGPEGLAVIVVTVLGTWGVTLHIGRRLRLPEDLTQLIAVGFSICGAAAIAAVQDGVRATSKHVALALALVTLYGTAMIALIPLGARFLGLNDQLAGIWAGASVHEVAQVVAVGSLLGPGALAAAVTVKLGRVLLLAPVHVLSIRSHPERAADTPLVPFFVVGFLAAVTLRSTMSLPESLLNILDLTATFLLAAGMFGLGAGVVLKELLPIPGRAVLLGAVATTIATTLPLLLVTVLW